MSKPFTLIHTKSSGDVTACLEEMLKHSRDGHLLGIAFAAMYEGRTYVVNACGEARRSPTFARGMVADLHEAIGRLRPSD
jgi:hypothetical protein